MLDGSARRIVALWARQLYLFCSDALGQTTAAAGEAVIKFAGGCPVPEWVAGTELGSQITAAAAAILLARFTTRPIPEICAMGGITPVDCTKSGAYLVILGLDGEGWSKAWEQVLSKTFELFCALSP